MKSKRAHLHLASFILAIFFTRSFHPRCLIQGFSLPKEEAYTRVLLIGIRKEARSHVLHLSRNKRYTLTPGKLKWDKFKLTYKYSPFLRCWSGNCKLRLLLHLTSC